MTEMAERLAGMTTGYLAENLRHGRRAAIRGEAGQTALLGIQQVLQRLLFDRGMQR